VALRMLQSGETNQLEREIGKALDLTWCIAAL
jgi:hypothetical protein